MTAPHKPPAPPAKPAHEPAPTWPSHQTEPLPSDQQQPAHEPPAK